MNISNRILYLLLFALTLIACDDNGRIDIPVDDAERNLTITLRVPGFAVNSRSVNENDIAELSAFFVNTAGETVGSQNFTTAQLSPASGGYAITMLVPADAVAVEIVANDNALEPQSVMTTDPNDLDHIVMYGYSTLEALESPTPSIQLVRTVAKVSVTDSSEELTVKSLKVFDAADAACVRFGSNSVNPNLPDQFAYSVTREFQPSAPFYIYEAEPNHTYIIIRASYHGVEGYYKAAFITADGDYCPVLRNHIYEFEITGINDYGWPTEKEACEALPDNRMEILLKDHDESIFDFIACRDYYLGVGKGVEVTFDSNQTTLPIVTSYKGSTPFTVTIPQEASWVTGYSIEATREIDGDTQSQATEYTLKFNLLTNNVTNEPRTATITVTSGDLSRTVTITQGGFDFFHSGERDILIYNLGGNPNGSPYFDFIDNRLKGVSSASNMTDSRDRGLHFSVYGNADRYYTISRLEGDQIDVPAGAKFSVQRVGDNWEIRCPGHVDYDLWIDHFTITNGATSIEIKVYHCGLFHFLTGAWQIPGPDDETANGWYYYEQVDVATLDGSVYHLLDRNLGASSNLPYTSNGLSTRKNTDARGGYFLISRSKLDNTVIQALPPEGYGIPEIYHFTNMGIAQTGAPDNPAGLRVAKGFIPYVFFPQAGAMDGTRHVDEAHTCLWSATLLSGNQGFSDNSPEYGYWYRYFDMYASNVTIRNARIGTAGASSDIAYYHAMPVRCVAGPTPPLGWDIPPVADGRRRIICPNSAGWEEISLVAIIGGTWVQSGLQMLHMDSRTRYYDIRSDAEQIQFFRWGGAASEASPIITLEDGRDIYDNI